MTKKKETVSFKVDKKMLRTGVLIIAIILAIYALQNINFAIMTMMEKLLFVFIIIEAGQLFKLIQVSEKQVGIWERVLEDPEYAGKVVSNAIFGIMEKMEKEPKSYEVFVGFTQNLSINVLNGIRNHFAGEGGAGINFKKNSPLKPLEGLINQAVPGLLDGFLKGTSKAAEKKAASAVDAWGNPL